MAEHGGQGGAAAAPIAKRAIEAYIKPGIGTAGASRSSDHGQPQVGSMMNTQPVVQE